LNETVIEKLYKTPSLKNPILVEGFPGVGNVGRIAVDFLIKKLTPKLYLRMYSHHFPNSVFINEDGLVELPKTEFYYYKNKRGRDIVFVVGDVQPADEEASYAFCDDILEVARSLKVREVITLGGISSKVPVPNPAVYGSFSDLKFRKPLEKLGVRFDRRGAIVIVGAAGLLLGLGKLKGISGFSLLAETSVNPKNIGIEAAKAILRPLIKHLKLDISDKDVASEIRQIASGARPAAVQLRRKFPTKQAVPVGPVDLRYIG
jgi:hypothetical protein